MESGAIILINIDITIIIAAVGGDDVSLSRK